MKYVLTFISQNTDYVNRWTDTKEVVVDVKDYLCTKTETGGLVWHLIGGHPVEEEADGDARY